MASPGLSRLPLTRAVKKVDKPRPLKGGQGKTAGDVLRLNTYEEVMGLADVVLSQLTSGGPTERSETIQSIASLAAHLKLYGQQLEGVYGDQLDRTFTGLRNFANDERFDILTRLRLLELIELRAMHWTTSEDAVSYYQHKMGGQSEVEPVPVVEVATSPFPLGSPGGSGAPLLAPGEVIKPSGKFSLPTKVPGKSYLKDEVVIRNADSGKVMGIKGRRVHMIEELSETIISFQRVSPGAKERLVQITGPSEERIDYARQLIEETIRRNASPSRPEEEAARGSNSSLNSSASDERPPRATSRRALVHSLSTSDASVGEYKHTVTVGSSALKVTGPDLKLVRAAKLILDEYFSKPNWQNYGEDFNTIEEDHLYFAETEDSEEKSAPEDVVQPPPASVEPPPKVAARLVYSRDFLLQCSRSPLAQVALPNWWNVARQHPALARKSPERFDVEAFLRHQTTTWGDQEDADTSPTS